MEKRTGSTFPNRCVGGNRSNRAKVVVSCPDEHRYALTVLVCLGLFQEESGFCRGDASSVVTSPQAKWTAALNDEADGTVISPDLKKTKKQALAAAHSMASSNVQVVVDHNQSLSEAVSGGGNPGVSA